MDHTLDIYNCHTFCRFSEIIKSIRFYFTINYLLVHSMLKFNVNKFYYSVVIMLIFFFSNYKSLNKVNYSYMRGEAWNAIERKRISTSLLESPLCNRLVGLTINWSTTLCFNIYLAIYFYFRRSVKTSTFWSTLNSLLTKFPTNVNFNSKYSCSFFWG